MAYNGTLVGTQTLIDVADDGSPAISLFEGLSRAEPPFKVACRSKATGLGTIEPDIRWARRA